MKRKGISPLIAAVLLIAFTMAVASIFAQWAPQVFEGTQDDVDEQRDNILSCNNIQLEVISSNVSSANIQLTSGDSLGDRNVSVTWTYIDADPVQSTSTGDLSSQEIVEVTHSEDRSGAEVDNVAATATGC